MVVWADLIGVLLVLVLVTANGFFVAAEFSLVAVRRSRVTQLVVAGRRDGSFLIDGMMSAQDAFDVLAIPPADGGFHTIAGFVLSRLGHLPVVGEHFDYEGWRFEVVDLDVRRIDKVMAIPPKASADIAQDSA